MCGGCNRRHNSDPESYLSFMNGRYGAEAVAELERLRRDGHKVTDGELLSELERLRAVC